MGAVRIRTEWGTRTPLGTVVAWTSRFEAEAHAERSGHPLVTREVRESDWEDVK